MRPGSEVAVLIVCHNGRQFLDDCLGSVLRSEDGDLQRRVLVVDNASCDGSAEHIAAHFPQVHLVRSAENLGFAAGNNLGWEQIRALWPQTRYLVLLNQDTVVQSGWLKPLVEYLEANPQVGCVQSKLMLHPQTSSINSAGNQSHFLGFGFTTGYGEHDRGQFDRAGTIDFASGAALMVRGELLQRVGLFDETLFLYLEDAELSWKLRQIGFRTDFVPQSIVYHKYSFHKNYRFYYYLERNRWWLLGVYYKIGTLLLLLPALLLMELGQLRFAAAQGIISQKLRGYRFFLSRENISRLVARRRETQSRRTIGDREFMTGFTGTIQSPEIRSPLLRYVGNPLLSVYWRIVRRLIVW